MKYHLVKDEKHAFTVKHPNGTHITIAKAGLSPQVTKKIQGMPKVQNYAFGTGPEGAQNSDDSGDVNPEQQQYIDTLKGWGGNIAKFFSADPDANGLQAPPASSSPLDGGSSQIPSTNAAPQDPTANLPQGSGPGSAGTTAAPQMPNPSAGVDIDKMTNQMQADARAVGGAGSRGIQDAQAAFNQAQKAQNDLTAKFQQQYATIDQELQQNQSQIMNQKVDPNRLWSTAGTGNKIAAALGLLVGGMGAGLTGQPNAALQVLNKQIDRDVEAQKANLGKQQTLFSMNMQRYHNAQAAEAATRLQLNTTLQAQLSMAALKTQNAQAIAAAKLHADQIGMQMIPYKIELAKWNMAQGLRSASDPQSAAMLIRLTVPEAQQAKAFEELGKAQNHARQTSTIMAAFDQANQDNTISGRTGHAGFEPASVARIQTALMPYLKDAEGRINEQELERTDKLIPKPGDSAAKIDQKRLGITQFLQEKAAFPTLDAYGVKVPAMTNASGGSSIPEFPAVRGNGR